MCIYIYDITYIYIYYNMCIYIYIYTSMYIYIYRDIRMRDHVGAPDVRTKTLDFEGFDYTIL